MKTLRLITIFLVLLFGCKTKEAVHEYPIMGNLTLGENQVGYKTFFLYDKTRKGIPYADWDGKLYEDHDPLKGRQFQINVWYPAKKGTGKNIKYDHYVNLMGLQTNFESETTGSMEFARKLYLEQVNALGGNGKFTKSELDKLLNLKVISLLEAEALPGNFPIVIYPNGSSPAFQSITCEFLASHGYIVVAFAPKGRFSFGFEVSTVGLETAVDDLEFVLSKIGDLTNANLNNISFLANAISSSVCVAAVSRNQKIKAMISLEGGFPSRFDQRLLEQSVFYQPENIQTPILMIYAPHPAIDPKYTYHLKFIERYYAHFPKMSEYAMLNFGMFDSFVTDIIGEHEGNTQDGFEVANQLALSFLNIHSKNEENDLFNDTFITESQHVIDTTFVLPGLERPPTIAKLKDLFINKGFDAIDSTYQSLKKSGNTMPFSEAFYYDYKDWLAWKKDTDYSSRQKLFNLAYNSYPTSPKVNYNLASFSQKVGNVKLALKHYKEAISLLNSSDLPESEKKGILKGSQAALLEL